METIVHPHSIRRWRAGSEFLRAYGALIGNVMVVIATVFGVFYVRVAARRS